MEKANATIGQGKAIHKGYIDETGHWWSQCGADHVTNRGMVHYNISKKESTCKRCNKPTK